MLQIKMFNPGNVMDLDAAINPWIRENPTYTIKEIKWHPHAAYLAMVIYEIQEGQK